MKKYRFFQADPIYPDVKHYLRGDAEMWTSEPRQAGLFTENDWFGWGQWASVHELQREEISEAETMKMLHAPELPL